MKLNEIHIVDSPFNEDPKNVLFSRDALISEEGWPEIGESVRLMNGFLEYTDNNNIEAILFSADFEKAFDSVDHTFLFATLTEFGFGPDFIQWVKTFLKDCESCVMNNGHSSGYFH